MSDYSKNGLFQMDKEHLDNGNIKQAILDEVDCFEGLSDKEIETGLMEHLLDDLDLQNGELPYNPALGAKGKWRVISSLQKAIRRGDLENAYKATIALHNGGEGEYLWRRVVIMVLEDIGLANLPLAALIISIYGKKVWRENNGGIFISLYIVEALCNSVKDRTLCNLAYTSYCASNRTAIKHKLVAKYNTANLLNGYYGGEEDTQLRQLYGLALTAFLTVGEKDNMTRSDNNKESYVARLMKEDYPTIIKYIIRKAFSTGTEGLHVALPIVWDMFIQDEVEINQEEIPDAPIIKGLPSVAYDMHTFEGKRAYAYYSKMCKPVAAWLDENLESGSPVSVIGSAVFGLEAGSVLETKLVYPYQNKMLIDMFRVDADRWGVSLDQFTDLCQIVRDNLDDLNYSRRRVIVSKEEAEICT